MQYNTKSAFRLFLLFVVATLFYGNDLAARTIIDGMGREVNIPTQANKVICSGSGCLRLLTYLQATDMAVAVDDMEGKRRRFDARPYALAHEELRQLPIFGEFRGHDNPELILTLPTQPQVILKTYSTMGHDPVELQAKTGIPVIVLQYGDLGKNRELFYSSLRIMAEVIGKTDRAEEVVHFFDAAIHDLDQRTRDIPQDKRPTVYVGGIAHRGPHGYQSTEPLYPPVCFVNADNVTAGHLQGDKELAHSNVSKESILLWDPEALFLELSTLQMGESAGGLFELKSDPAYGQLTALKQGKLFGLLPYNWYTTNYGSILANSFYIGKVLYPEQFADIDPRQKADEIFSFLVGKAVFDKLNQAFGSLIFSRIPVQ